MFKWLILCAVTVCCLAAPTHDRKDDGERNDTPLLDRPSPINPDVISDPRPQDKVTIITDPKEIAKHKRETETETGSKQTPQSPQSHPFTPTTLPVKESKHYTGDVPETEPKSSQQHKRDTSKDDSHKHNTQANREASEQLAKSHEHKVHTAHEASVTSGVAATEHRHRRELTPEQATRTEVPGKELTAENSTKDALTKDDTEQAGEARHFDSVPDSAPYINVEHLH